MRTRGSWRSRMAGWALLGVMAGGAWQAEAQERVSELEQEVIQTESFMAAHPDLESRSRGWEAYQQGDYVKAMEQFRRGARYADKPSQGMVAEMLWRGEGGPRDVELAYAWMDLAAERGYENFVILRERYWQALTPEQQASAIRRGRAVYAEYGDDVAKPRIATVIRRARMRTTGSRTGAAGNLKIQVRGPGGVWQTIDGSQYYAKKFWDPEQYQAWQDAIWRKPKVGQVNVGEVEPLRPSEPESQQP